MFVQHSKSIIMDLQQKSIAVIDKNPYILASLPALLQGFFSKATAFVNPDDLMSGIKKEHYDVVMLDIKLANCTDAESDDMAFGFLKKLLHQSPDLIVVLMTRPEDVDTAVQALDTGAKDFVLKPWSSEKLIHDIKRLFYIQQLEKQLTRLRKPASVKRTNESLNLQEVEKKTIEKAVYAYQGNMTHTAKQLGITRATLYAKMKKYGLAVSFK